MRRAGDVISRPQVLAQDAHDGARLCRDVHRIDHDYLRRASQIRKKLEPYSPPIDQFNLSEVLLPHQLSHGMHTHPLVSEEDIPHPDYHSPHRGLRSSSVSLPRRLREAIRLPWCRPKKSLEETGLLVVLGASPAWAGLAPSVISPPTGP